MQKQLLVLAPGKTPGLARRLSISSRVKAMAAGMLVAGALFSAPKALAQNTLLTEDFETGGTSWTIVNGTQTNKWFVGSAIAASGTQSAYISDNATGTTNNYTLTTTSLAHIYKDVTFPAGESLIYLTFKWKAQGESTSSDFDNLKVFASATTATVTAGTAMPSADRVGLTWYNLSEGTGYITTRIALPAAFAGTSKRLVFSWKNDVSGGTQPPVSIDDILITTQAPTALTGTYTINNTLPTNSTNFSSFTEAINALNVAGISGAVTFNVAAGQTFSEDAPAILATGTATNTVTFQKSGTGANPILRPNGSSASTDAGIIISGGDFFTFDGVDITSSPAGLVEYGYIVRNASATNGALNNTIKNAKITLNRTITSSVAVLQSSSSTGGGVTATNLTGVNQNNTYNNLAIENVYNGILLISGAGTFPDNNTTVSNNIVGGTTAADLGNSGSTAGYGIKATFQNNVKVFNNEVRNSTVSGTTVDGIFIDQAIGLAEVYNNRIHDLRNSGTTSTSAVVGMRVNTYTTTTGNNVRVYNNFVYGLTHAFNSTTVSSSRRVIGIFAQSNGSGSGNTLNFDFNSIRIDPGSTYTASSSVFEVGTASGPVMNVRNNIFANFSGAQTGVAKHYVWVTTGSVIGATGSVSNNNDLYIANFTNGFVSLTNATDRTLLSDWSAATSQDQNSKSSNPQFISATDLHISPTVPTEVEGTGSFFAGAITWANNDIDANVRNTTTPDMGADEGNFITGDLTNPIITMGPLLNNTSSTANRTVTATISDAAGIPTTGTLMPRLYFSKGGAAGSFVSTPGVLTSGTATNGTWTFTIDNSLMSGVANGDRIFYFVVAQDISGNTASSPTGNATVTNVNSVSNITSAYAYYVNAPIAGVVTVPGTYPSLTLAGGLFEAINRSVLTGNVTVNITADLTAETGANNLGQWIEEGAGNYTLTIRPDAAVNRTISGTSVAGFGLIRSNGADRVTIDGSFNGAGNFLTIIDNGAVGNTFALLATGGAVNNTFRNLNIKTGSNAVSGTIGIFVSGVGNNNLLLENNNISKANQGIQIQNDATTPSTGLIIRNNTIGSQTAADYLSSRGIIVTNSVAPIVSGNTIFNIQTSLAGNLSGIEIGSNVTNGVIDHNRIFGLKSTNTTLYGSFGIHFSSTTGVSNNTIHNNMIYDLQSIGEAASMFNPFGIRLDGGTNTKIYYNSINMTGAFTGTGAIRSAALLVNSTSVTGLDVRNNIFVNSMTGTATTSSYAVYALSGVTFGTINYNDYFVSGAAGKLGFLGADKLTLADWKTATTQDANSLNIEPVFTSATDLHLESSNLTLNNTGTPITGITTDFDNDVRSTTTPDIGLDEFTPASLDLGAFALVSPTAKTCFSNAEPVVVTIKNLGTSPINFATSNATLTTTVTVPTGAPAATLPVITLNSNALNGGNPLAVGATVDVPVGTLNMGTPGNYTFNAITAVTTGGVDGNISNNDMAPVTITVAPLTAGTASATSTAICQSGVTTLNVTGNTGGSVQWQSATSATGPFTNITGATTNSFTLAAPITATTYYQAVTSCGTNSQTSNVVTVTVTTPVAPTVPAVQRCGPGVVNLTATAPTGTPISWYTTATGGSAEASGATYSPNITATTTYYVTSGGSTANVGATSNAIGAGAASNTTHYQIFNVLADAKLNGVYVYPSAAGNVVLVLQNSAGTVLQTATVAVTAADVNLKTFIPLNWNLTTGTGYKLGTTAASVTMFRNTAGASYPYTIPGVLTITGNTFDPVYYYYAYDWIVSTGCESSRTAVVATVNPLPAPTITGLNATYCTTDPAVTLAGSIAGSTFTVNGTAATTFNPATLGAGTHTVIVSSTNASNCTGTATQTVTVSAAAATPTITAGGSTTICAGSSVVLTAASTTTGATYQWFENGTAITGATNATFTANAAGSYTVVATDGGCASAASTATAVTVTPLPTTPTITQNGGTLTSSSATGNQWYLNGVAIAGATGATYVTTANGNYTVVVTANGCASATSAVRNVTNTGIADAMAGMSVDVYPNPATGSFNVKLTGYQKDANVVLYNLAGQRIATEKVSADGNAKNISLKGLAAGTYLLKVTSEKGVQVNRLIVQ